MAITKAEPGKTRIGWIGTGVMGRWMCQHLMTKGYKATVYNRSKDKAQPLLDAGRRLGRHAQSSRRASPTSSSPSSASPRMSARFSSAPKGRWPAAKAGTILVDMTTSEPSLAREIYDAAKAKGVHSVDAPVSGGDVGAKNAALSIMIGGDADVVEAVKPLLRVHGQDDRPPGRPPAPASTPRW